MTISPTHQEALQVALQAAYRASGVVRTQRSSRSVSISLKGARNLVTTADLASEKVILQTIKDAFPTHAILAEESALDTPPESFGVGPAWIIDPIDGTTNFAQNHFQVGISIAYAVDGIVQVGVVAAPFLNEVFTATKGGGAFCNETPITISPVQSLGDALIVTGFPYDRSNISNICGRVERILRQCRDLRRLGAASLDLCWVACGRLDGYFEECLQPWDVAAGSLIAREAGAVIDHFEYDSEIQKMTARYPGDLYADNFIATTPSLITELKGLLNQSSSPTHLHE